MCVLSARGGGAMRSTTWCDALDIGIVAVWIAHFVGEALGVGFWSIQGNAFLVIEWNLCVVRWDVLLRTPIPLSLSLSPYFHIIHVFLCVFVPSPSPLLCIFDFRRDTILAENPDLMAEYKEEIERMKAAELTEQSRLLREVDRLETELAAASSSSSGAGSTGTKTTTAFVGNTRTAAGSGADAASQKDESPIPASLPSSTDDETSTTVTADVPVDTTKTQKSGTTIKRVTVTESGIVKESTTTDNVVDDDASPSEVGDGSISTEVLSESSSSSSLQLPPFLQEALDKYIPKSAQVLIGNILTKIKHDLIQLLKLQFRLAKALVGQIHQRIEDHQKARANSAAENPDDNDDDDDYDEGYGTGKG